MHRYILTLSCADRPGIVAGVSQALAAQSLNIVESAQFGDADSQRFFMRVAFDSAEAITQADFTVLFAPVAGEFGMGWQIFDTQKAAAQPDIGFQVRPLPDGFGLSRAQGQCET